jgi:hypothetical protein
MEKAFYKTTQPGYYGDITGADALVLKHTGTRARIAVYNLRSGEVECKTVAESNLSERLDDSAIDEVLQQALKGHAAVTGQERPCSPSS